MEKISVFGGTGFVGGAFYHKYSSECVLVDRNQRIPPTDNVLYFISTISNYNVFSDLTLDINTNLLVLMETLQHCKSKGLVFNFISSWFVYGKCDLPAGEDSPCDPRGFYSITKLAAEKLLVSFCETFGVNYRILRLSNIYGPGDTKTSKEKNAIQWMVTQLAKHQPVNLYENGEVLRDLLHVDDAARAIHTVLEKGDLNTIYNIGSGYPTKLRDLIDLAVKITHSTSQISSIPTPEFHKQVQTKDFYFNTHKLQQLGFEPRINLEQGIKTLL